MIPLAVLAALCVYLMVDKHIERHRAVKREQELLDRIMSRDYFQYATGEAMKEEAKHPESTDDFDSYPVM